MSTHSGRLAGLQVVVTGVSAMISRDVVRQLVAEGASVTAADADEDRLTRLQRDLGLYRTSAELAFIDLQRRVEMSLFAENLKGLGRLPHLLICCCREAECQAALARLLLRPSLMLHSVPAGRLRRTFDGLTVASLPRWLDPRRGGLFNSDRRVERILVAGSVFNVRWGQDPPGRATSSREQASAAPASTSPRRFRKAS